ncbi:MAG: 30S ribosomal protein S24e [Haloquadratum sp.]|jgi:small subunit ribosomal protein S24e|nr:30S ribosomal protein S24e [Haloquadratum sp.]
MELEIISEDANPLLHRTDVRFSVTHEAETPSRLSVRDSLAAQLNKDAGEVVIQSLKTRFGMRETIGYAKVYDSPDHAADIEAAHILERNKIGVEEGEDAADPASEEA